MSNYHVELIDKPAALDQGGDQVAAQAAGPGAVAPPADADRDRDRHRPVAARGHRRHARLRLAEPQGRLRGTDHDRRPRHRQAPELARCRSRRASRPTTRRRAPSSSCTTPASSGSSPARTRPATARRSTSGRSTSAARTSAASRTRASRTSGSSARATGRATTGSGSRPPAPSSARRRGAWTASRSRSTTRAS